LSKVSRSLEVLREKISSKPTVIFWGAGPKVPGILEALCSVGNEVIPKPSFIMDSTRALRGEEFGIPTIEFSAARETDPTSTLIVITAGLLDLQSHTIRNGLYYHEVIDHRALELFAYLQSNPADYEASLSLFSSGNSRNLYEDVVSSVLLGSVWNPGFRSDNPYFGNKHVQEIPPEREIIFAGAFNGKHITRMIQSGFKGRINAFEPNPDWAARTAQKFETEPQVTVDNLLLGDDQSFHHFHRDRANGGLAARVVQTETADSQEIPSVTLDSILSHIEVGLVALDVEGAEPAAIRGASEIIKSCRPILAICIYHNPHDLISLPLEIERTFAGLYTYEVLQHSSATNIETVLYALPLGPS
jgi:FkbM family methyltransferase